MLKIPEALHLKFMYLIVLFKSHHGMYAGALLYLEAHFLISQSVMAHW